MFIICNIGSYLNDPHLVAYWQQFWGIEINCGKTLHHDKPSSNGNVNASIKDSMTNNVNFKITRPWLYYLASFGAFLGNESFNCCFFPFWLWNVDGYVGRRIVLLWAIALYVGQYVKDVVCWPRPRSPPVAKLEQRYELEYGMPSTHATVGLCMPFSILLMTISRYQYNWYLMIVLCVAWTSTVSFSRIYLGMHSVLEVLAGLVLGALILLLLPFLDAVDDFQLTHAAAPFVMVLLPLIMAFLYPTLHTWSTARGDTTMILACSAGLSLASWLAVRHNIYSVPIAQPPYLTLVLDLHFWLMTCLRMLLGGLILIVTRSVVKFISYRTLCWLQGISYRDTYAIRRLSIELPLKFLTYTAVSFNVGYLCPLIFKFVGIFKATDFVVL